MKNCCRILFILFLLLLMPTTKANTTAPKQKIVLIINGVKGKALANIQARLNIKQEAIYAQQPDIVKWRYYLAASAEIKAALQPYGFFRPKIKTHLKRTDTLWQITADIKPGKRLKFTQVSVVVKGPGEHDRAFQNYLKNLPVGVGRNFNSDHYEHVKDTLKDIANARGYFKAKMITSKLVINLEDDTSAITIVFETGPRYQFGETEFSASPLNDAFLARYLEYQPGQVYLSSKLEKSRDNLSNSNYFQQVIMIPELKQAHDRMVPVKTTLTPQDQVVYSLGAGYGTTTGPRALASMDVRWLNRKGHGLKVLLRGSEFNSALEGSYVIPGMHPAREFYSINAGLSALDQVSGTGKNVHSSFAYHNSFASWRFTAALNYLIEKYQLNNVPREGSTFNSDTNLLYPSVTLQRTYAKKNILNPDYGYNVSFTASGGVENIGSRTSFSQYRLDSAFLYTLPTHTRILPRASIGYTTIQDLSLLPLSMQFYAGGFSTVRSFLFNQIGPGRFLTIGSFEMQQRIWKNFYLAGFIDAGMVTDSQTINASTPQTPLFKHKFNVGTGPGLVYLSPIGAVELTAGKVIDANDALNGRIGNWVFQFGLGVLL